MSEMIQFIQDVKSIKDIDVCGKRVMIRVDFNVHLDSEFKIINDNRIKNAMHTIHYCVDNGAKHIILLSHLGSADGMFEESSSLKHVLKKVESLLGKKILFIEDFTSQQPLFENLSNSELILFENLRFFKQERQNDAAFSKMLASFCDIYVNDSFGTSHHKHASTYGITDFVAQSAAGFALLKELNAFSVVLENPVSPVTLVVGGTKISSKIPLLHTIMQKVDKMIIGGAISNTFLKAMGYDMQGSLFEDASISTCQTILKDAAAHGVKIYLPIDAMVTDSIENPQIIKSSTVQEIPLNFACADIGPATIILFSEVIESSNTIIWNGPMGMYENPNFFHGTSKVAEAIASSYAYSIIGGSDTAKVIDAIFDKEDFSFISSGGASTLLLLEGKILPGLQNLDMKQKEEFSI